MREKTGKNKETKIQADVIMISCLGIRIASSALF